MKSMPLIEGGMKTNVKDNRQEELQAPPPPPGPVKVDKKSLEASKKAKEKAVKNNQTIQKDEDCN